MMIIMMKINFYYNMKTGINEPPYTTRGIMLDEHGHMGKVNNDY